MKKDVYRQVIVHDHPYANQKGCVYVHRLMAEKKIGRYLLPEWRVHHINHNRQDNRPENLMVFASDADHSAFHKGYTDFVEVVPGVLKARGHIGKKDLCPMCGGVKCAGAEVCRACDTKRRNDNGKPSKAVLLKELETTCYEELARKYGVTGNAVRKWVKKYEEDPRDHGPRRHNKVR